jgi:ketosteroid isomerase-like protein
MSNQEFDAAIEAYRQALRSMMQADHKPVLNLYSRRDDVTLANPLGPPILGWANIEREAAAVAAGFAGGSEMTFDEVTRFATPDLGYVVAIERAQARRKGSDQIVPMALRVTTILRREEGKWMIALRHADRVTERAPSA